MRPAAWRAWPRTDPARSALVAAAVLLFVLAWPDHQRVGRPLAIGAGGAALAAVVLVMRRGRGERGAPIQLSSVLCAAAVPPALLGSLIYLDGPRRADLAHLGIHPTLALGALAVTAMAALGLRGRAAAAAFGAAVGVHTLIAIALIVGASSGVDVWLFQHDAVSALLHGHDPYAITFPDVYGPDASRAFYGPGLVAGGRVLIGFPYPPVSLLLAVPGHLLGDVRYSQVAMYTVAPVLAWRWSPAPTTRLAAVLLLLVPGHWYILFGGWTEPLVVGLLAVVVDLTLRGSRWAPVALGLLLAAKQYLLLGLPLATLLLPSLPHATSRRRAAAIVAGVAFGVTLPFVAWGPAGFYRSVVMFQLRQPLRTDAESLAVYAVLRWGWPAAVASVAGLAVAAGLALVLAVRAPRTPAGFSAALGVCLAWLFLLSKQAFGNYYLLVVCALLLAVAAWGRPPDEALETGVHGEAGASGEPDRGRPSLAREVGRGPGPR